MSDPAVRLATAMERIADALEKSILNYAPICVDLYVYYETQDYWELDQSGISVLVACRDDGVPRAWSKCQSRKD